MTMFLISEIAAFIMLGIGKAWKNMPLIIFGLALYSLEKCSGRLFFPNYTGISLIRSSINFGNFLLIFRILG